MRWGKGREGSRWKKKWKGWWLNYRQIIEMGKMEFRYCQRRMCG